MPNFPLEKILEIPFSRYFKIKGKTIEDYEFIPLACVDIESIRPKEIFSKIIPKEAEVVGGYPLHFYTSPRNADNLTIDAYGTALIPRKK